MEIKVEQFTSKFLSLQARDFLKALIMAALAPVVTLALKSIDAGQLDFDWKAMGRTALAAGIGYLIKNFFEPTKTVTVVKPPIDELKNK